MYKYYEEPASWANEIYISMLLFNSFIDTNIKVTCNSATFGLDILNDKFQNWAFVNNICKNTLASRYLYFTSKYKGAYITAVNNTLIYTKSEYIYTL